ncbi:MAG TPA: response regulator transcription factor [Actinomycetota bacterium]|nr:response regulator transcription factor [Actinomycetota bacterium]
MAEEGQAERTYTALVVDDVNEIRFLLTEVLSMSGRFEVVGEAGDGLQAIDEAGRHEPDIVLLDLSMPKMDGLEALPQILSASPGSKVIVLSGFEEKRLGAIAIERGASAYLEKGVHPNDLVREVLSVLEGAQ